MLIAAIAVAGTVSSFTDWLFMGVLFHDRYNRFPEVWWPGVRDGSERSAIIYSSVLGYVGAAAVAGLCALVGVHDIQGGLIVSILAWVAGPLVMQVTNGFWIKTDPAITLSHSLGYLARFLIAGVAAGIALS